MRRLIGIALVLVAAIVVLVTGAGIGGDEGTYEVRAVFDNAGFLVEGEEVRIAGANVGVVTDVSVSGNDEPVLEDGGPDPGKAVVTMRIDDPAFQNFRVDASCLIRPQSLIGEKFVECEPTQPRATGAQLPPELPAIAEGEPGEGQHLLPLERNGKSVDLDLVNNIMEEPYPDRFRLILNDLGAGLAARGDELAEIVERANPALRETNEVLGVLGRQNRVLAQLATDSDTVISALARERARVASFINESEVVGSATAERGAELEESLVRFPGFLRELRSTMDRLDAFSTAATPVFGDLEEAAPSLVRASEALGPFSTAATRSLTTLGTAAEGSGPNIAASDPVIRQVRSLANSGKPAATNLRKLLASLRKTNGFKSVTELVFNASGVLNPFDSYGHFIRGLLPTNNCVDFDVIPEAGCNASFAATNPTEAARVARRALAEARRVGADEPPGGNRRAGGAGAEEPARGEGPAPGPVAVDATDRGVETEPAPGAAPPEPAPEGELETEVAPVSPKASRDLLDFLIGESERRRERGKRR